MLTAAARDGRGEPGTPRVYVVDDDAAVRAALSLLVRTCGWQPVPCADVGEFFERYAPRGQQCVICDLAMPGCSGTDLQHELNRRGDPLPVIVVTAHHDGPQAALARAQGARAVLAKPVHDAAELIGSLERALDGH